MSYDFSVRSCDLNKLNSMTKYPSIPTYHALGDKGRLLDEFVRFNGEITLTEKVDGTNSRIIMLPDGNYILGSREELLFAKGDLIGNPALGIVNALRSVADLLPQSEHNIIVVYLELYGGKVTAASKQYTAKQNVSWRLFDVAVITDIVTLFTKSVQQLAAWRDNGGQTFLDEDQLKKASIEFGFELTPRLATVEALPISIEETYEFLQQMLPTTKVALDEGAGGRAEGIVARTYERSAIAKIRFEDYERHTKRRQ
ncbi:RNA ligase family protein [Halotia branconii]|uniref:RNA ligase family protein n=1 Tax=Halotia branconii CENA392 TaxID=1539056 RepID=A0AAJ6P7X9_9CYAN|nr:RNA ligase family protein [Halotia branconii]WGV24209.1 RNA ligase family protein [Halotia branconii CENA392]